MTAEYEAKIAKLTTQYPLLIARRMAEGLLKGSADETVRPLLEKAESWDGPAFETPADFSIAAPAAPATDSAAPAAAVLQHRLQQRQRHLQQRKKTSSWAMSPTSTHYVAPPVMTA